MNKLFSLIIGFLLLITLSILSFTYNKKIKKLEKSLFNLELIILKEHSKINKYHKTQNKVEQGIIKRLNKLEK